MGPGVFSYPVVMMVPSAPTTIRLNLVFVPNEPVVDGSSTAIRKDVFLTEMYTWADVSHDISRLAQKLAHLLFLLTVEVAGWVGPAPPQDHEGEEGRDQ
jgi:hypothetical protein